MGMHRIARTAVCASFVAVCAFGQAQPKVDFARDVQPIFRQNCIGCHGPSQQINGLRLDRRSSVFRPGARRVVPGSSANSFLLHRLNGNEYGLQMPPTGALRPAQIAIVKRWIDEGAVWPDALANETELPPLNAKAVAMADALRLGKREAFLKLAGEDPKLLNARGPDGATPFMYATLYAPADFLAELLKLGADPNRQSDHNATALMWAVTDLEKTRLLVEHGADVNARADTMRTPLIIAAGRPGGAAVVKLLLEHGAKVDPNKKPGAESSPLIEGATAGDAGIMRLLMEHGADVKAAGQSALSMAITSRCQPCFDMLMATGKPDKAAYTGALGEIATLGDVAAIRRLLDAGADVNADDPTGRSPLIYAAGSDLIPLDAVKLLVERGANVNGKVGHPNAVDSGWTVLDVARTRGETPIVDFLLQAGAKDTTQKPPVLHAKEGNTIRDAVALSLPRLQRADANFVPKAGCISCHSNSLDAMTLGMARSHGFRVDEATAAQQVKVNAGAIEKSRDILYQGFLVPVEDTFGPGVWAYMLIGLAAEHHPADLGTDAAAMYLKMHQTPDGEFPYPAADTRPPLCSDYIGQTVLSMRALQLYAPATDKAAYRKSVELAAAWIAKAQPKVTDDYSWRVIGLAWAGADGEATQSAMKDLLALQRADGGWGDIPTMESGPYSTGKALVALRTAGLAPSGPAYQKGVRFLLDRQQEDGSWYVKTRALAFQPYFDSGFSHGFNQYISAAGSSWATMALALASEDRSTVAGR